MTISPQSINQFTNKRRQIRERCNIQTVHCALELKAFNCQTTSLMGGTHINFVVSSRPLLVRLSTQLVTGTGLCYDRFCWLISCICPAISASFTDVT